MLSSMVSLKVVLRAEASVATIWLALCPSSILPNTEPSWRIRMLRWQRYVERRAYHSWDRGCEFGDGRCDVDVAAVPFGRG